MRSKLNYKKSVSFWLLISIGIVFACLGASLIWSSRTTAPEPVSQVIDSPKIIIKSISSNTLFLGNIYWGRYINDWSMTSELKYAYPFSRLNEFDREKYNAWISTLECPTVDDVSMTSAQEDATLTFNCSPNYLPEASKWFDILSLSNNHTDNQGAEGFEETKAKLELNNIQYFGSHDPDIIPDACEVIALPVSVGYDDGRQAEGELPVAMCGYQGIFQIPSAKSIDQITKFSQYLPTFAMPHMGAEYVPTPDQIKTSTYQAMVDAGADMVIGDHPHVIQTTEVYNGVPIFYSMGNFIFDQQGQSNVTLSAGINVVLEIKDQDSATLEKWLAIGKNCREFKDNCLKNIQDQQLKKLDVTYKIGIVGANDNDKIVKPATPTDMTTILSRLKWAETVKYLQAPYSEL